MNLRHSKNERHFVLVTKARKSARYCYCYQYYYCRRHYKYDKRHADARLSIRLVDF